MTILWMKTLIIMIILNMIHDIVENNTEYNQIKKLKYNQINVDYDQINEYENDSDINYDSDLGNDEILTIEQIENEYNDDENNNKKNEKDNCWNIDEVKLKEMKLDTNNYRSCYT